MNPLAWPRPHQIAAAAFCAAGALSGLVAAWFDSGFHRICSASLSGQMADCSSVFLRWLSFPSQYGLFMAIGGAILGLLFYAFKLSRC